MQVVLATTSNKGPAMGNLANVHDQHHHAIEKRVREELEEKYGYQVLKPMTYHEVLPECDWLALSRCNNRFAMAIRTMPDIMAVDCQQQRCIGIDIKTNSHPTRRNWANEAMPLLNAIINYPGEVFYWYIDTVDQSIGERILIADKNCPCPKQLYLTPTKSSISRRVLELATAIWPDITITHMRTHGSDDPFVVWPPEILQTLPTPDEVFGNGGGRWQN